MTPFAQVSIAGFFDPDVLLARAAALVLALALDLVLGDPPTPLHPVAWLGSFIAWLEPRLRASGLDLRIAGVALAALVVTVATGTALVISSGAHAAGPVAAVVVDALLIWVALAAASLAREGAVIGSHLSAGDLSAARERVARIVARRTDVLDATGVARACVESLGENVVDGVIAPLFWAALLGPAGAWLHKSASTLDSMVGYRNERYARLGTASARLDDVLAWLPARLAVVLIPVSAVLVRGDAPGAWHTACRDRLSHESPNSAHGEAAFAGALGVCLGGTAVYADRESERPLIGAGLRSPSGPDCARAAALVRATTIATTASLAALLLLAAAFAP